MEFTIVIVVKDDPVGLSKTIKSLINIMGDVSVLIVTPFNDSETFKLANQYAKEISNLSLVADEGTGIYQAMNKGLWLVQDSSWIWYLNANDELTSADSFKIVREKLETSQDTTNWAYTGFALYESNNTFLELKEAPKNFSKYRQLFARNFVSHQSTIVKAGFMKELNGFDLTFKVAADWDLICRMYDKSKPLRINTTLSNFKLGGYSSRNRNKGNYELLRLRKKHLRLIMQPYSYYWFIYRNIRNTILSIAERFVPNQVQELRKFRSFLRRNIV